MQTNANSTGTHIYNHIELNCFHIHRYFALLRWFIHLFIYRANDAPDKIKLSRQTFPTCQHWLQKKMRRWKRRRGVVFEDANTERKKNYWKSGALSIFGFYVRRCLNKTKLRISNGHKWNGVRFWMLLWTGDEAALKHTHRERFTPHLFYRCEFVSPSTASPQWLT